MLLALVLLSACSKSSDFTPPAFLHLDGITLTKTPSITTDDGFFVHQISAAYVVAHYPDRSRVDTVGIFRLPFTVPVLYNGKADYIAVYPAVEMSGISGALPYYTYYFPVTLTAADSTTLSTGDTLYLGTLTTAYRPYPQIDTIQLFEPFERPAEHIRLQPPLEWIPDDPTNACTGNGYGRLTLSASDATLSFDAEDMFVVSNPDRILYLELDIKSTLPLSVYMRASSRQGAAEDRLSVMTINPIDHWQHLYINLGRTWAYFNHPSTFHISFTAVNENGTGGTVDLDNVKLLTTNITL
jgi:hypothetical protein